MTRSLKTCAAILVVSFAIGSAMFFWPAGKSVPPSTTAPAPGEDPRLTIATPYKNVRPDARYVDDDQCATCHAGIADSYRKHPMGRSLTPVAGVAAGQRYDRASNNPFTFEGIEFLAERRGARVFHTERRRDSQGRVFAETEEEVQFAIGSGIHNYSYLFERDGRIMQSPITWYEQKKIWDLSPGYAWRRNLFERPVFAECLFCHSNRVDLVKDTLNTYHQPVFRGYAVGCQRCHGPGQLHVQRRESGEAVAGLDDTIVNPRRLSPQLREAVCQQCHLEGVVRILAPGRDFFDYRPGLPWQLFWSVLVRSGEDSHTQFVSAVEQMTASRCFRASDGRMGCISCHDPHYLPAAEEKTAYYQARCLKCHQTAACTLPLPKRLAKTSADDCTLCHMPSFGTTDIQHTAASDHQIPRNPRKTEEFSQQAHLRPDALPLSHFNPSPAETQSALDARALALGLIAMPRQSGQQQNDWDWVPRALPMIEEALKIWPDDVPTLETKANALAMLDRKAEQFALCNQILSKAPRREQTLVAAAALARHAGRPEEAIEYWKRALAVNPWPIQYHAQLANLYADRKDWPAMLDECQAVLRRYPASVEARLLMVSYYVENGERARAQSEFDILLALKPPNDEALRHWFQQKTAK